MRKATEQEAEELWRAIDVLYPLHGSRDVLCTDAEPKGFDDECRRCAAIRYVARRGIELVPRKEGKGERK